MGSSADLRRLQSGCLGLLCSLFCTISYPLPSASKIRNIVSLPRSRARKVYTTTIEDPKPYRPCDCTSLVMMSTIFHQGYFPYLGTCTSRSGYLCHPHDRQVWRSKRQSLLTCPEQMVIRLGSFPGLMGRPDGSLCIREAPHLRPKATFHCCLLRLYRHDCLFCCWRKSPTVSAFRPRTLLTLGQLHSTILTLLASIVQLAALIWYLVSYFPLGSTGLRFAARVGGGRVAAWMND